ncbi:MAG: hypothetical protein EXR99_14410 [Gemmataceae bacterium]|nr:hypothetical protein [Gemmataceae bacterium]
MKNSRKPITRNTLRSMASKLLQERIQLFRIGVSSPQPEELLLPHRVMTDAVIDPAAAWSEAVFSSALGWKKNLLAAPPGWASFASSLNLPTGAPLAAGMFPQLVRSPFDLLNHLREETALPCPLPMPEMENWACEGSKEEARKTIAAGICSLAGEYQQAEAWLRKAEAEAPAPLHNEWGACHWMRGDWAKAQEQWAKVKTCAGNFNRGLALAKLGEIVASREEFTRAADALPESTGWHHLARLYQLAL